jgi:lipopolysaccharide transport system ATP-binding protein
MGTISVNAVGKYYKRYAKRWHRLVEWVDVDQQPRHEKHWVLRNVSFDIRAGESVAIIGENGAGKSTLLKIITGTTLPSAGSVRVSGQIAALLELGMGFHPDFTGRENAYMAGQLLGFSRDVINTRMEAIEAFADIGNYIDQPVRTYSSGMQVRLAFSVATCIRPEVLIIDEALSVGDIFFQQKCFDRIAKFRELGTTLLFVTHGLSSIYALCDRVLMLVRGELVQDGDPKTVINIFQRNELEQINRLSNAAPVAAIPDHGSRQSSNSSKYQLEMDPDQSGEAADSLSFDRENFATDLAHLESVAILQEQIPVSAVLSGSLISIAISIRAGADLDDPHIGFQIRNLRGEPVFMTNTYCMDRKIGPLRAGQIASVVFSLRAALAPGDYTITVGVGNDGYGESNLRQALLRRHGAAALIVLTNRVDIRWAGVCNLYPTAEITSPR